MKIPTATVSGDNLSIVRSMCRDSILGIAEEMKEKVMVNNYSSEYEYEYAMLSRILVIRDIVGVYLELNNTMENK